LDPDKAINMKFRTFITIQLALVGICVTFPGLLFAGPIEGRGNTISRNATTLSDAEAVEQCFEAYGTLFLSFYDFIFV
jgi:hypothetical protein